MNEYGSETAYSSQETRKQSMEKAANNVFLLLISRYSMAAVLPVLAAMISVGGWAAARLISTVDRLVDRQTVIDTRLASFDGSVLLLQSNMTNIANSNMSKWEDLNRTLNSRFDAQGRRIDRNDIDIDEMKRRVYAIPAAGR